MNMNPDGKPSSAASHSQSGDHIPSDQRQSLPGYFVPLVTSDVAFEIDLRSLTRLLLHNAWLFLVCIGVFVGLAFLAAMLITPTYRAAVVMMPASWQGEGGALSSFSSQLEGVASLAGIGLGGGSSNADIALATLRSRDFTGAFITDYELLPVLFDDDFNELDPDAPTLNDAIDEFDSSVRQIHQDLKSGAITLVIKWEEPELAAQWANALVARLNEKMRDKAISDARNSIGFLENELKKTSISGVQAAIYRLMENEIKNIMLAHVRSPYAFEIVDPAVAPDADNQTWPDLRVLVVLAVVMGFVFAFVLILLIRTTRGT
ncbi:MAG: hypothetical protein KJP04_06935 [Arenicella sp.]|nr:hypothetical protein [Arenicella sp.]